MSSTQEAVARGVRQSAPGSLWRHITPLQDSRPCGITFSDCWTNTAATWGGKSSCDPIWSCW